MRKAIFVGGTGSNVGKSWMTTALCRMLKLRGVRVAPFKAQNMSNNSYPCAGGGEIGRAQVAQAEACGLEPCPAMNPVLLKPMADSMSQIVLHGRVWKTVSARDYYQHTDYLRIEALNAFDGLARNFDVIVLEGAGSVAELNLWDRDIVNLSMARAVDANCLLVADIERGGVFASVLGTFALLPESDRARFRGFAVNRFRGDADLFADGVQILEQRAGVPCLGVFPFAPDIRVDAEDSLASMKNDVVDAGSGIAIVRFPRISNTTDFQLLPGADWIERPSARDYDFIILPGTKSTIADLGWLREAGLDGWIRQQHERGAQVIGICGGYQMLGASIADPEGVDGAPSETSGLGLLPVRTVMQSVKRTVRCTARLASGATFEAYEIHMGTTELLEPAEPFALVDGRAPEGVRRNRVTGTYLHGALEDPEVCREIFGAGNWHSRSKREQYDNLAKWFESHSRAAVLEQLLES